MSTIYNMINLNQSFKNKNFDKIKNFINNLTDNYTKNDQRIIHNTILNILNKKKVSEEEINILNNIVIKLSKNLNTLNTLKILTLFFLMTEIYDDLFERDNNLEIVKNSLRNIPNNIIKLLLDIFEKAKNSFTINTNKLNKEKYFESLKDKAIANIIGYYRINDDGPITVLFYGRENKNGSKFKLFLDPIPLKELSQYYTELSTTNTLDKEKFSLINLVSGKSPKIERDGDKYKFILEIGGENPIIYTDLEKKGNNDFKLINPLSSSNKNNPSKNNKNPSINTSINNKNPSINTSKSINTSINTSSIKSNSK